MRRLAITCNYLYPAPLSISNLPIYEVKASFSHVFKSLFNLHFSVFLSSLSLVLFRLNTVYMFGKSRIHTKKIITLKKGIMGKDELLLLLSTL